jgi:hypothetical protein
MRAGTGRHLALAVLCTAAAGSAQAEVKAVAEDGFIIEHAATAQLSRDATWTRLLDIGGWWSDAHTYSGKATSMQIDAVPGGCWCEIWPGGEVEHGQILTLMPPQMLRLRTELGPLQALGVTGALTFTLADGEQPETTKVIMTYRVSGASLAGLRALAPIVDQVLGEQMGRLAGGG